VQQNQDLIRTAPLHIYHSALAFAPKNLPLFDGYREKHNITTTYVMDNSVKQESGTLLIGHHAIIQSMIFSPDDTRLATRSWDESIRLWDTTTGADIAGPMECDRKGDAYSWSMAFSSDGATLAVGYSRGNLALWDGRTGHLKSLNSEWYRNKHGVSWIYFSPDDSLVFSASAAKQVVYKWDITSGCLVHRGELDHDEKVTCFSISFDGHTVASGSGKGIITLWSVEKCERLHQIQAPECLLIQSIVITPGDVVSTISEDGTIRSWEGRAGKISQLISMGNKKEQNIPSMLCSPSGEYIASVANRLALWRRLGGQFKEVELFDAHFSSHATAFSPDSKRLASILDTGQMRMWNTETGRAMQTVDFEQPYSFTSCAISHNLNRLAVADSRYIVRSYATGLQTLPRDDNNQSDTFGSLNAIELSPNQELIVTASEEYALQTWSAVTGKKIGPEMIGHASNIITMAFSPDSRLLVSGSFDGTVRLWKLPAGEEWILEDFRSSTEPVSSAVFSPNGEVLAAGWVEPGLIHLWNVASGRETKLFLRLVCRGRPAVLAFSCDSELIVGAQVSYIEGWSISDGRALFCVKHNLWNPRSVVLSPKRDRLAMLHGASDCITIWDLQGAPRRFAYVLIEHLWPGSYLSITPNGYLVFGSQVWEIRPIKPQFISVPKLLPDLREFRSNTKSLLSYREGWVHSALVGGELLAIPRHLGVTEWSACGNIIAFATLAGRPLIIDCSPMLE
jgi:WD40 repeat protein